MSNVEQIKPYISNSKAKRPAPFVDQTVESRKLLDLYFDRDYILDLTEAALLDGDLTEVWKIRAASVAWKETPSGSLPADSVKLKRLMAIDKPDLWDGVKDVVLADWVECSNGRLYQRDVADRINRAWRAYSQKKLAGEASAAKRRATREEAKAEAAKPRE